MLRAWADRGRFGRVLASVGLLVTQSVTRGAEPQLLAATKPGLHGGEFYGPSGPFEMRGHATEVQPSKEAADPAIGVRLWATAEELTRVTYL